MTENIIPPEDDNYRITAFKAELKRYHYRVNREWERFYAEIRTQEELAELSERFEIQQLISEARIKGLEYGAGYEEGFNVGYHFSLRKHEEREKAEGIQSEELLKRQSAELDALAAKYV